MTAGARKWIRFLGIGFALLVVANSYNGYRLWELAGDGERAHAALCRADAALERENRQTLAILRDRKEMKQLTKAGLTKPLLLRGVRQRQQQLKADSNLKCERSPK